MLKRKYSAAGSQLRQAAEALRSRELATLALSVKLYICFLFLYSCDMVVLRLAPSSDSATACTVHACIDAYAYVCRCSPPTHGSKTCRLGLDWDALVCVASRICHVSFSTVLYGMGLGFGGERDDGRTSERRMTLRIGLQLYNSCMSETAQYIVATGSRSSSQYVARIRSLN